MVNSPSKSLDLDTVPGEGRPLELQHEQAERGRPWPGTSSSLVDPPVLPLDARASTGRSEVTSLGISSSHLYLVTEVAQVSEDPVSEAWKTQLQTILSKRGADFVLKSDLVRDQFCGPKLITDLYRSELFRKVSVIITEIPPNELCAITRQIHENYDLASTYISIDYLITSGPLMSSTTSPPTMTKYESEGQRLNLNAIENGDPREIVNWKGQMEDHFDRCAKDEGYNLRYLPFSWSLSCEYTSQLTHDVALDIIDSREKFNEKAIEGSISKDTFDVFIQFPNNSTVTNISVNQLEVVDLQRKYISGKIDVHDDGKGRLVEDDYEVIDTKTPPTRVQKSSIQMKTVLGFAARKSKREPLTLVNLSYDQERKALAKVLEVIAGSREVALSLMSRDKHKGGVSTVKELFDFANMNRLRSAYKSQTKILFKHCWPHHKLPLMQGNEWGCWKDYVEALLKMKHCVDRTPSFALTRALVKEIVNNGKVNSKFRHLSNYSKADIRDYCQSIELLITRACKDWTKKKIKGNDNPGVNVHFYQGSTKLFDKKDHFGPACAELALAIATALVPDHQYLAAMKDLALKENKYLYQIDTDDVLANKVSAQFCMIKVYSNPKFHFLEKLTSLTKRTATFDLETWSSKAAINHNQVALSEASDKALTRQVKFAESQSEQESDAESGEELENHTRRFDRKFHKNDKRVSGRPKRRGDRDRNNRSNSKAPAIVDSRFDRRKTRSESRGRENKRFSDKKKPFNGKEKQTRFRVVNQNNEQFEFKASDIITKVDTSASDSELSNSDESGLCLDLIFVTFMKQHILSTKKRTISVASVTNNEDLSKPQTQRTLKVGPYSRGPCPSLRLSKDCLTNKFKNINYSLIIDSGAQQSVIPSCLLDMIVSSCIVGRSSHPFSSNLDASGNEMPMSDLAVDLDLVVGDEETTVLKLRGAMVLERSNQNVDRQILVGTSDMRAPNFISLINSVDHPGKTEIVFGASNCRFLSYNACYNEAHATDVLVNDFDINKDRVNDFDFVQDEEPDYYDGGNQGNSDFTVITKHFDEHNIYKKFDRWHHSIQRNIAVKLEMQENNLYPNDKLRFSFSPAKIPEDLLVETGSGDEFVGSTESKIKSKSCPNSEYKTNHDIEKLRAKNLATFTHEQVTIDPDNEVLANDPDRDSKIAFLRNLLEKYKEVFRADTGCVTTDDFMVNAQIDLENSDLSSNKVACYVDSMSPELRQAICDKFNKELADGVLKRLIRSDITLKNILPCFAVAKKGGDDQPDAKVSAANIRLIADCSRAINGVTVHKGRQGDDIRQITRDVTRFTRTGYLFSIDISDCFHCIRLHPDLYPYFGVQHPDLGDCYYVRLPQGWISSPSFCKDFLLNILKKYSNSLCRYADDVLGGADTWEEYCEVLEGVLATLKYSNLRLKGKKVTLLGYNAEFLGRKIEKGMIKPSPHHIDRISKFDYKAIPTKKALKRFNGLVTYLSEFKYMAAEEFFEIRKLAEGPNTDKIDWTPKRIETFEKVKQSMDNLINLHCVDPDLQTFLVTDTSKHATGAILYQMKSRDSGLSESNVIGLFSRKRTDLDNVHAIPSCVLELSGIAAAATHFRPYIERLNKKLIIYTDSKSAEGAYRKFQNSGVPTNNMRLSSFLAAMWGFHFDLVHIPSNSKEIEAVDYLSRYSSELGRECTDACSICKTVADVQGSDNRLVRLTQSVTKHFQNIKYADEVCISADPDDLDFHISEAGSAPDCFQIKSSTRSLRNDEDWKQNKIQIFRTSTETRSGKKAYIDYSGPIQQLLLNFKILNEMQDSCSDLRRAKKILGMKQAGHIIDPSPNRHPSVRTLVNNKSAKLDSDGVLYIDRVLSIGRISRILPTVVLPPWYARTIVQSLHTSYGDMTVSQILRKAEQVVSVKNIKKAAQDLVSRCPGCILLKNQGANPRSWSYKEAPLAEKIGQTILIDEVHRMSTKNKTVRFLYATDSLSRYSKLYYIKEESYKFSEVLDYLVKVRKDFTHSDNKLGKMLIRMDKSRPHLKASKQLDFLKKHNIEIELYDGHSPLSVSLPELDGRLQKISKMIGNFMARPHLDFDTVATKVENTYNNTVGQEKFAPIELWTGKQLSTGRPIKVPVELLVETIRETRASHRQLFEKKLSSLRKVDKLHFVPYSNGTPYNSRNGTPLKAGDLILLVTVWDKNDKCRFWKISDSIDNKRSAINWDEKLVHAYKLGVRKTAVNGKLFSFDAISWVIDGDSTEAKNFESDLSRNLKDKSSIENATNQTQSCFRSTRLSQIKPSINDPFFDRPDYKDQLRVGTEPNELSYENHIRLWDNHGKDKLVFRSRKVELPFE